MMGRHIVIRWHQAIGEKPKIVYESHDPECALVNCGETWDTYEECNCDVQVIAEVDGKKAKLTEHGIVPMLN